MQKHDIIVIGASAGGVSALKKLVKQLPADFKGSIFIVLHIPAYSETSLHDILTKAGPVPAVLTKDGETINPGKIYVGVNDHHLILENGNVIVKRGPKENRFRPSIDALFRSAAYIYGPRVIGIILSGILDDGVSGLWTIKRHGGITIIQEPADAEQPQLPINAGEFISPDYQLPAIDIGSLLVRLSEEPVDERPQISAEEMNNLKVEISIATKDNAFQMGIIEMGVLTPFTCPECHGSLVRLVEANIIRYRCHTGHAYTSSSLLADLSASVEDMLWQSMRGMEEMVMLLKNAAEHFDTMGKPDAAKLFRKKSENNAKRARVIYDSVFTQEQYSEDLRQENNKRK